MLKVSVTVWESVESVLKKKRFRFIESLFSVTVGAIRISVGIIEVSG